MSIQRVFATALLVLAVAVFPLAAGAQAPAPGQASPEGIDRGGYNIQQSIELGYRFVNGSGNQDVYGTFVNLNEGPRLLEQTLSMQSLAHTGVLFDNLYISSFGWGGDPNNAARLRLEKDKWYNLKASFRRDQNFFNYDLLANPMRVFYGTTPDPTAYPTVNFSPHAFQVTRRMADVDLTLLPQSNFSIRLGYSRNRANGPSYSSYHEGVDILADAPWDTTYQTYRFGFDMKLIPKTNISFDQFLQYGKNDTDYFLNPFGTYTFAGGRTFDGSSTIVFGLPAPSASCIAGGVGSYTNCSGYTSYSRLQRVRTTTPTSQLSLQSRPHKKLEVTGRFSYSSTDMKTPFDESFTGLITRTRERAFDFGGEIRGQIIAVSSDFGVTVHLTDKLSLSDTFRWINSRQPAFWDSTENALVIPCKNPLRDDGACPSSPSRQYGFTDAAFWTGITGETYSNFLGYEIKSNTVELSYNLTKNFGARIGYRYAIRNVREFAFEPEEEEGHWDLPEHTGLFGVWLRPIHNFRLNGELELTSNGGSGFMGDDGALSGPMTRLSPRNQQHYRVRANYSPSKRFTFAGTANILENRNGNPDIDYKGHNRNVGFSAAITPNSRFSLDLSYNYNNFAQNNWICFVDSFSPLPAGTLGTSAVPACPTYDSQANPTPLYVYSEFNSASHYGSFVVTFKPVKRVSMMLGYGATTVDGSVPKFNGFYPLGALNYTFHQPLASVSFELAKNWTFNTYWNYDQYNEPDNTGSNVTAPRYFRDNRAVLSMRYAF